MNQDEMRRRQDEAKAERQAKWESLPGGYRIGPDSPPGIGWVLELPPIRPGSKRTQNRYYSNREQAREAYRRHLLLRPLD